MALSVGTELAALLLGANGTEAGPRRAPGGPTAALPGADGLPGFADLLAAATGGEPVVATAPNVVPQPGTEPPTPAPAIRPQASLAAAMPWDALAAAAEAADGLAAPFQWPGHAQPAPAIVPEAPASVAEELKLPAEPDTPTALEGVQVPLPLATPTAPPPAADQFAKMQEIELMAPAAAGEAPFQSPLPEALPASVTSPVSPGKKPPLEKPVAAAPSPANPMPTAASEVPGAAVVPMVPPPPAAVASTVPVQDGPQVMAAVASASPAVPRPSEARRGDAAVAPAQRAEIPAESAVPIPLQPVEATDPLLAATTWKDMPATPRESEAKSATSPALAPAVESERPATTLPIISFEAQRPADSFRPVAAPTIAPLVIRPHQVAEAGQQIVLRTSQAATEGVETISVDLRPPELGRVELRLTFRDGTVQVSMTAERVETYEAFRHDRASLEQQMQQAGLQLGSGGLDLQHGRLPPREGGEPERRLAQTAELAADEAGDDALAPLRARSDSLIDLIA